jgi:class 3 adenylate cyclase
MKKRSKYRLYVRLTILSAVVLAGALIVTSSRIIQEGKSFTQVILKQHEAFLSSTIGFGHVMMAHMGSENYDKLIKLAIECESVRYFGILDKQGKMITQSMPPGALRTLREENFGLLKNDHILEETDDILLISYKAEEIILDEEHRRPHATFERRKMALAKPGWFLVGLDTSLFKDHNRHMVVQTIGTGIAFLLLGILLIVFLGIVQRYELAHLAIEKLHKIRKLLGHFVPQTAKNMIEKDPEKRGLLDKYIQDATILFLDIEGFSLLVQKYSQERINRTIETYFSAFLDIFQKKGGDINETAGDGMMVIFQDPDPAQHAKNATQTALQIQEKCSEIKENGDADILPILLNIGIQSGQTYLGSTKMRGSEGERWTFTASGAVTILAARLSQFGHGGQILIGEETARRVNRFFPLIHIGKATLKNIEDSGEIFQLVGTQVMQE